MSVYVRTPEGTTIFCSPEVADKLIRKPGNYRILRQKPPFDWTAANQEILQTKMEAGNHEK